MTTLLRRLKQERAAGELPVRCDGSRRGETVWRIPARPGTPRSPRDCLDLIRQETVEGDLVDVGTGRGGVATPHARVPRGSRARRASRLGGRPIRRSRRPPTPCGRRSPASTCSTIVSASSEGAPPRHSGRRRRWTMSRCSGSGLATRTRRVAVLEALYDRVAPGVFIVVDAYGADDCRAAACDAVPARNAESRSRSLERIDWSGAVWRRMTTKAAPKDRRSSPPADRRRRTSRSSSSSTTCAARRPAPSTRSRARYQQGDRRPRLRGDRRRERVGTRPAARRGVRAQLRPGVPLPRPRATRRRRRPSPR